MTDPEPGPAPAVSFREAFRFWLKLGFINFGGPTGQIAIMHQELVERRRWISDDRFLHALNYCMLLPGPEAHQLAIHVGWLLHRTLGGLVAGIFFVLPGSMLLLGLSWLYVRHGQVDWVFGIFHGLRAGVVAIVAAALLKIGQKALKNRARWIIAAAAFVSLFALKASFPLVVLGAGLVGLYGGRRWPKVFLPDAAKADASSVVRDDTPPAEHTRPSRGRFLRVLVVGLAVWWGPLAAVAAWRGPDDVLTREAIFFSGAAMVTFGGAYALLVYLAQAAVEKYHWMAPGQMLDGLGMAETTPGPLILVTQFVGFVGAFRNPGSLPPMTAAVLGAAVTVWATFVPSFLWIFLGAPFIEHLRGNKTLTAALSGITAAVVGVVLNLAVWFGLHTLFSKVAERTVLGAPLPIPEWASLDPFAAILAGVAFVGMWRWKWGIVPVVAGSAALGLMERAFLGGIAMQ